MEHKVLPRNEWFKVKNELLQKKKNLRSCGMILRKRDEICHGKLSVSLTHLIVPTIGFH
jgi:hypothetical protein